MCEEIQVIYKGTHRASFEKKMTLILAIAYNIDYYQVNLITKHTLLITIYVHHRNI